MKKYNLSSTLNPEVTDKVIYNIKANGYSARTFFKYIIEHDSIVNDLCEDLLSDLELYGKLVKGSFESRTNYNFRVILSLDCNHTLNDLLRAYNININTFLAYLASRQVVDNVCSEIPSDLKLKKYQ